MEQILPKIEEAEWVHNWLYSMIPVSFITETTGMAPHFITPMRAYLTGFCKNCRKVFSQEIPAREDGSYLEIISNVPVYGCVGPESRL